MIDAVIDLSHFNANVDFKKVAQAGILGVIHKATQGLNFVDRMCDIRKREAEENGLLFAAYHFGIFGDGAQQAEWFLKNAEPRDGMLCVLDIERNFTAGQPVPSMTLVQAAQFINAVADKTARKPLIYGGEYLSALLDIDANRFNPSFTDAQEVITSCDLWIADYTSMPNPLKMPGWDTWSLWQWSDKGMIDGVSGHCDRSRFNGTADDMKKWWTGKEAS